MPEPDTSATPATDSETQAARDGIFQRALNSTLPVKRVLGTLLVLAVCGPVVITLIVYAFLPNQPWWFYLLEVAGAGWMAPLLFMMILLFAQAIVKTGALVDRYKTGRQHGLVISMVAARTQHYQGLGVPDPMMAATCDVTAYLGKKVSSATAASWETDAATWYSAHASDGRIAPLPQKILSQARKSS